MRFALLACSLLVLASGCVEFVDGAGSADGGPDAADAVTPHVVAASTARSRIELTLVRAADGQTFDLGNASAVQVTVGGYRCHDLGAGGDATWAVGETVLLTPQTTLCGLRIASGAQLSTRVLLDGRPAGNATVVVQ